MGKKYVWIWLILWFYIINIKTIKVFSYFYTGIVESSIIIYSDIQSSLKLSFDF